jgi:hypothetical protein
MNYCFGLPGGNRTPGLLLRRQLLYPTELRAAKCASYRFGAHGSGREPRLQPSQPRLQLVQRSFGARCLAVLALLGQKYQPP